MIPPRVVTGSLQGSNPCTPAILFDNKEGIDISSLIDKYNKEELEDIVSTSFSYAEVLSRLGYSTKNGHNHKTLKNRIEYYNISTAHFSYRVPKRDWTDEEIFCEDSMVSQNKLRSAFKERGFVPYKCATCGLEPFWNGKPLVLTLDHINGKNKDNQVENLQWVCPNCDRQSDTYGMKNKKNLEKNTILISGNYKEATINDKKKSVEIPIPDRLELKKILWEFKNYTQVANYYNVSTTQIRRWCRKYDLPATINIINHTSEEGWVDENWNDFYKPKSMAQESIPCYMIDKNTNEILNEFPSRSAAARYLGVKSKNASAHIGAVCSGNRVTAYGYKWRNVIDNTGV